MALSREYLEYLDNMVEIAPANSQEELQAAQEIASLMQDHGVETRIEEFDAPAWGRLPYKVLFIVMFLGLFMSGLGGSLAIFGMLLTVAAAGILIAERMGMDLFENVGPTARSQNVVGFHKAEGPLVTKGSRPIVVVAHYDTGRENFLSNSVVGPYLPLMNRFSFWCVIAVGVIALLQVFGFIPAGARRFFWVLGLIAALPLLLLGVSAVATRLSPCTEGANDNKSGVAAMLGVLEDVRPTGKIPVPARIRERVVIEELPQSDVAETLDGEVLEDEGAEVEAEDEQSAKPAFAFSGLPFFNRGAKAEPAEEADLVAEEQPVEQAVEAEPSLEPVVEEYDLVDIDATENEVEAPVEGAELATEAELDSEEAAELESFASVNVSMDVEDSPAAVEAVQAVDNFELVGSAEDGVRHGKSVIEDLGILPGSCEIEYLEPTTAVGFDGDYEYAEVNTGEETPNVLANIKNFALKIWDSIRDAVRKLTARINSKRALPEAEANQELSEGEELYPGAEPMLLPLDDLDEQSAEATNELATDNDPDATILTSELVFDEQQEGDAPVSLDEQVPELSMDETSPYEFAPQDESGLESFDSYDMSDSEQEAEPAREAPASVEDANWGKSEYEPATIDIARRASLFDLPDPSESDVDPLAPESPEDKPARNILNIPQIDENPNTVAEAEAQATGELEGADDGPFAVISGEDVEVPEEEDGTRGGLLGGLFGRKKNAAPAKDAENSTMSEWLGVEEDFDAKKDGREIGDWEHFDSDDGWKGGAAVREGLRGEDNEADNAELPELDDLGGAPEGFEEDAATYDESAFDEGEETPSEEELREAILSLNDDALLAHDIWFVALGSSDLGHAGMEAFLAEHRSEIHGAFLVNLDSVGAGDLSLLTSEGSGPSRRADRRMIRLIKSAAADMHVDLVDTSHDWGTTDATPAMRRSVRGLTIMGTEPSGMRSLSQSEKDILENLDVEQIGIVNDLVTEMIRRS